MTAKVSWRKQGVMILAVLCVLAGLSLLCPALGGTVRAQESAEPLVLYMEDGKIIFDKDNHFYQGDRSEEIGGREVIIRQHDPSVPTGNIINIYGNEVSDLSITLDGVNIDSRLSKSIMPNSKQPALYINTRSTEGNRDIEITLAPGSVNTLVSDGSIRSNQKIPGYGALHVGGHDSDNGTSRVTIKSDPSKPGHLNATNYGDAAGINYGTNNDTLGKYPDLGDLVIEGGIITAQGGPGNVGIGCSHKEPYIDSTDKQEKRWTGGGTLQVIGGTVTAIGGEGAVGIGVPAAKTPRQFSIQIDGGSVHAEGVRPTSVTPTNKTGAKVFQNEVTVAGAGSANTVVTSGTIRDSADMVPLDYGLESVYTDEHSRLWFYLPANDPGQRDKSVMEISDLAVGTQTSLKGSWWVNDPDAPEETVSGENSVQVAAHYADNAYAFKPGGSNAVVYTQDISKPMAPAFVTADTQEPVEPAAAYYKDAAGNWSAVNGNSEPAAGYQIAVLEPAAEGFAQKTAAQPYEIQKARPLTVTDATVAEKIYDGANGASVTGEVTFDGLDSGDTLERDKDYTVTAAFADPEAREDKDVTVIVTLLDTEKTAKYIMADGGKLMTKATIAPRPLGDAAITVDPIPDQTYTGNPIVPEAVARFEGAEGSVPLKKDTDYTAAGKNNTNVGTAMLILTGKGNYTGTREVSFNITKAEVTGVSFEDASFTYDGKSHEITLKGDLPKGASVTYENNTGTDAGAYQATAKIKGGANYQDKTLTATLTIAKAEITGVSYEDASVTYDGKSHEIKISGKLPKGTSVTYENNKGTDAGAYQATAKIKGGANYQDKTLNATLTITKAEVTSVSFEDASVTYDGKSHSIEISGKLPEGASVTYENNKGTDAGAYQATAKIDGGTNYQDKTLNATLTVTKAEVTGVSFEDASVTYDGKSHEITLKGDLPKGASVTYKNNTGTEVGAYQATANINGGANHQDKTLNATLTITKAEVTSVSFEDASVTYDGKSHELTLKGELPKGASVTYENNRGTDAGAYQATAKIKGGANYQDKTLKATLTITKAEITGVSFEDVTVPYDGKSHEITLKGKLPKGASVTYENNTGTEVGTYHATAKIKGGANYKNKTLNATLTIKAPNPYVPVKPTNPGEAAADIDKLPGAQDYDKLPPEQQELVKEAVKTVAQGIAELKPEQQAQIPVDKIEKLGELYDKVYKITIHKDTSAADGLKNYVKEEDIQIFGAGMAAQSLGSDVRISITQDPPADGAIMAFSLDLFIDQNGKYIPAQLKTPIVIKFTLPDGVSGDNLVIRHLNPDGKLKELLYPEINGRELTFMTTSFSNFLFVETGKPTPTPPTPSPTPRPTPADNSNTLKNPVTGLPMSTSEAALLGLSAVALLTLGAVSLRRHDAEKQKRK